jgi:hypothetical protein
MRTSGCPLCLAELGGLFGRRWCWCCGFAVAEVAVKHKTDRGRGQQVGPQLYDNKRHIDELWCEATTQKHGSCEVSRPIYPPHHIFVQRLLYYPDRHSRYHVISHRAGLSIWPAPCKRREDARCSKPQAAKTSAENSQPSCV